VSYNVRLTDKAAKDLRGMDGSVRPLIIKSLEKLASTPEVGKPLTYEFTNLFSYRASSYRIIYRILGEEITVLVVAIGHRREVYDRLRKIIGL